jgi:hypothetical protein
VNPMARAERAIANLEHACAVAAAWFEHLERRRKLDA